MTSVVGWKNQYPYPKSSWLLFEASSTHHLVVLEVWSCTRSITATGELVRTVTAKLRILGVRPSNLFLTKPSMSFWYMNQWSRNNDTPTRHPPTRTTASVGCSCQNKMPLLGWLTQQTWTSHSSGVRSSRSRTGKEGFILKPLLSAFKWPQSHHVLTWPFCEQEGREKNLSLPLLTRPLMLMD